MKSRFLYMLPPIIGVTLLGSSCGSSATQASSPRISTPSTQGRPTAAAVATKSAASTQSGPAAPSCPLPVDFPALAKLRGVKQVVSGDAATATFQLPISRATGSEAGTGHCVFATRRRRSRKRCAERRFNGKCAEGRHKQSGCSAHDCQRADSEICRARDQVEWAVDTAWQVPRGRRRHSGKLRRWNARKHLYRCH